MPLLPYSVFLADNAELPRTGVEDRVVHRLDLDDLTVIYSELGTDEISRNNFKEAAFGFHEVVHAVFEQRAVIPFRFPTFLTEAELRNHLDKESQQYANFLRAHAHDVQMEIRIYRTEVPRNAMDEAKSLLDDLQTVARSKPANGTEYMMRLLELKMPLQNTAREVQRISEHLVHEWKTDESRDAIRLFALIPRKDIDNFRDRLSQRVVERADTHMRVTGPWPATDFFPGSARPLPHNVVSIRGEEKS